MTGSDLSSKRVRQQSSNSHMTGFALAVKSERVFMALLTAIVECMRSACCSKNTYVHYMDHLVHCHRTKLTLPYSSGVALLQLWQPSRSVSCLMLHPNSRWWWSIHTCTWVLPGKPTLWHMWHKHSATLLLCCFGHYSCSCTKCSSNSTCERLRFRWALCCDHVTDSPSGLQDVVGCCTIYMQDTEHKADRFPDGANPPASGFTSAVVTSSKLQLL